MIGLTFFQFFTDISFILSLASWLSLVLVAYWVYESDERIEFLEKHVWKRLDNAKADLEIKDNQIEDLRKRVSELEAKNLKNSKHSLLE